MTRRSMVSAWRTAASSPRPTSSSPRIRRRFGGCCRTRPRPQRRRSPTPAKAAVLDVALAGLPRPANILAFGIDRPLYYSVHSATAKLAPEGGAVIHAAKYLNPLDTHDPRKDERQLERLLDMMQPGWREQIVTRRFLPAMTVTNAIPTAAMGGLAGRAGVEVKEIPGLYIVGDWVGSEGTLANAAVASAALAAKLMTGAGRRAPQ